jgi:hypothetical protein
MTRDIARGAWDRTSSAGDARWRCERSGGAEVRVIEVPAGTHIPHLERGREGLFTATGDFLAESRGEGRDSSPPTAP